MALPYPYQNEESDTEDEELQLAFAKGLLKPGLNVSVKERQQKHYNNISRMEEIHKKIKLDLPFVERFDLQCEPAVLAPELAKKFEQQQVLAKSETENKDTMDDFVKEMYFHRLAQAAVLEGFPKLHALGVPTKRPQDYFAEMAKSDEHMQKVRKYLKAKETIQQKKEEARNLRLNKKFSKQKTVEGKKRRQEEKSELMKNVKKFQKGEIKNLEFLDNKVGKRQQTSNKRDHKNKKYGFGGPKRNSKRNTKADFAPTKRNAFPRNNKSKATKKK